VKFEVVLEPEATYYPISKDLSDRIRSEARKQGVSSDTLVNLWLEQKVEERNPRRGKQEIVGRQPVIGSRGTDQERRFAISYFDPAGGPDEEFNGLALCTLHHKLFDRGVFTLSDKLNIVVSVSADGTRRFQE
jgi:hypothetical protein